MMMRIKEIAKKRIAIAIVPLCSTLSTPLLLLNTLLSPPPKAAPIPDPFCWIKITMISSTDNITCKVLKINSCINLFVQLG